MFGLTDLDEATGGLQPGHLTLIAAAPGAGGSLLALAAARHTALSDDSPVLYAAAGLTTDTLTRWTVAAEAGVDLRRLRTGTLTAPEQQAAEKAGARLGWQARLFFDDGVGLTAEAIAETAPYVDALALIVVDRLHHQADPHIPLSGDQVPPAARTLKHLARQLNVPVLAVLNTDDDATVRGLDADLTLTLAPADEAGTAQVTVAERDFGQTTVLLQADLQRARFTNAAPAAPAPAPLAAAAADAQAPALEATDPLTAAEQELAEAALPFTSGATRGLPSDALQLLADHRQAVLTQQTDDLPSLRAYTAALSSAAGLILPNTPEGQRLRATLDAFAAAHRAHAAPAAVTPSGGETNADQDAEDDARTQDAAHADPAVADQPSPAEASEATAASPDPDLQPGDEGEEPEGAPFPALRLLKQAVARSKMHPIPVVRKNERDAEPWTLCNEIMDGEPRWVHPDVESVRTRGGKRRMLIVPDSSGLPHRGRTATAHACRCGRPPRCHRSDRVDGRH
ncbi:DnaB-like helicase C-terminal domain-containing protein [Streptomyces sp. NPDC058471]|uniref:DnaB-like helicase C-terminal domain-containing protein n=1 Tax=Streptomyces sp. NPDC058471 TaxID=3346516 RepID=UPI00365E46CE